MVINWLVWNAMIGKCYIVTRYGHKCVAESPHYAQYDMPIPALYVWQLGGTFDIHQDQRVPGGGEQRTGFPNLILSAKPGNLWDSLEHKQKTVSKCCIAFIVCLCMCCSSPWGR